MWSRFRFSLRNLLRKQQVESDLDTEIGSYVEAVTDEEIAGGLSHDEARRRALAESGGIGLPIVSMEVLSQRTNDYFDVLGKRLQNRRVG